MVAERHLQEYVVGHHDPNEKGGWIFGHFMSIESQLRFEEVEIAVMDLPEADPSPPHYHRESTEFTFVLSGQLEIIFFKEDSGRESVLLGEGDYMLISPETVIQNPRNAPGTRVFVVKWPSVPEDKYYFED